MRRIGTLIFAALLSSGAARADGDPDLGTRIVGAFAADGKLWLSGADWSHARNGNALVSLSLSDGARTLHFRSGVVAMMKLDGHLWVLRQARAHEDTYWLLEWKDGAFASVRSFERAGRDAPFALAGVGGKPAVISLAALRVLNDGGWQKTKLDFPNGNDAPWGVVAPGAPREGGAVYLGFNRGEWGGGMLRLDPKDGKIAKVEGIDPDLDPVNGIVADPAHADCVVAAVGLIHFLSKGAVVRVCGDKGETIFANAIPGEIGGQEEAFFGLVSTKGGYWAVGSDHVYRFGAAGAPERFDFPKLESWHGAELSRALPGVIVLSTDMNRQFSVSGTTPLIVSLED
ncbi:MAG TPA: hypothetical protein VG889_12875 [Rhizomicrobium sp.]|nr:hypothetical protein [Rhizomicrobium sp.]